MIRLPYDHHARMDKAIATSGGSMARSTSKPTRKKSKGKAGSARRSAGSKSPVRAKPADWGTVKVTWPQPKQAISLRIDQDILTWFRGRGPGYQTRMNAVLRAFVDAQQGRR
jgi:uncharacterized protein (DUF4415 family)